MRILLVLAVVLLGALPIAGHAAQPATFTDAQRAEIESIVHDYLVDRHPETLSQAIQVLQKRDQDAAEANTKEQLASSKDKIYNDPATPTAGNPKGSSIIVEFFDYQCGYCKMAEDAVERILREDKNVKMVYKQFPILGPASTEAAKASLAAFKQGKFAAFHEALMNKKERLTSETIIQTAKDAGLDVERLKKDMNDPVIDEHIKDSLKLGQDLGVRGTPLFLVNDQVYPGALQYEQLKEVVGHAREAKGQ